MRADRIAFGIIGSIGLMLLSVAPAVAQAADGGYRLFRPDGPGPHPAVVFLSGCSGFTPAFAPKSYELHAERLRALGFVVVWADYLGRRNLKNCEAVSQGEAARDAVAAVAWLRSQLDIDAKRIAAMGWSYGGGSVLVALGSHSPDQLIFSRVIAFYPYCGGGRGPWSHRTPVLVLLAGDDDVAPHSRCKSMLEPSSGQGDVKIIEYPGALHAFDSFGLPLKMEYTYGTLGYHPQAAAAAWAEVIRFLQPAR